MTDVNDQPIPVPPTDQPTQAPQPPAAQQPTQQPTQQPPAAYQPQPVYSAPAPQPMYAPQAPVLTELSGGMKFGWLVVGLLMGIPGMIIAWLVNVDKMPQVKSDAVKFAVIGFVINIVAAILIGFAVSAVVAATVNSLYYYL